MVDFDAFVFVKEMDAAAGQPLADLRERWTAECDALGIDFDLRIIEGPYKPAIAILRRPAFVVHLGVFTETLYLAASPLKRWAWRKYICEREPGRLARLAPSRPTLAEFAAGPKGLRERCAAVNDGSVEMTEWLLPSLQARRFAITLDQTNFVECCFAYAANTARNHARALGLAEADQLGNSEFFAWYNEAVFRSPDLIALMDYKAACRDQGFVLQVRARAISRFAICKRCSSIWSKASAPRWTRGSNRRRIASHPFQMALPEQRGNFAPEFAEQASPTAKRRMAEAGSKPIAFTTEAFPNSPARKPIAAELVEATERDTTYPCTVDPVHC